MCMCIPHRKYYQDNGELMLDVGAYTAALEYALTVQAELIGKPSLAFFQSALDDLGLPAEDVCGIYGYWQIQCFSQVIFNIY